MADETSGGSENEQSDIRAEQLDAVTGGAGIPGLNKPGDITLKRGIVDATETDDATDLKTDTSD